MDDWKTLAPPTDRELKQRGLGFYHPPSPLHRSESGEVIIPQSPRPPDIVAAELDARMIAYKKGLTPRRDTVTPPNEVILAVDMARAAYVVDASRRPAPLDMGDERGSAVMKHGRSVSIGSLSTISNSEVPPQGEKPPKSVSNGYSMGTSVPDGVRWRYVDVLNTSGHTGHKKKSPVKSPKHRISTAAAIHNSSSRTGKDGEVRESMMYNRGGSSNGTTHAQRVEDTYYTGSRYTTTRKASV